MVYAASWKVDSVGIFCSSDFGASWSYWEYTTYGSGTSGFLDFAVSRGTSVAYGVATGGNWISQLYRTGDGGSNWSSVEPDIGGGAVNIEFSPAMPSVFVEQPFGSIPWWRADVYQGRFGPLEGGGTFGIEATLWDPSRLHVAGVNDEGGFCVRAGGVPWQTWTEVGTGLPEAEGAEPLWNFDKFQFEMAPSRPIMFVALWWKGLWMMDASDLAEAVGAPTAVGVDASAVYPNPSTRGMTIRLRGGGAREFRASIMDVLGHVVWSSTGRLGPDALPLSWNGCQADGQRVPAGVYSMVIRVDAGRIVRKLVIVR